MYRTGREEIEAVSRVIESKQLFRIDSKYQEVANFEKELAQKIGVKYAICLSGGTPALISALVGLGIGPGDEVIVPAYTFMATPLAVLAVGAIPVIAEVDESLTIDPNDIVNKISCHTKAIIPVHMVGFPCDIEKIMQIADEHNIKVVEDACQADGGSYKGKRLGSIGHAGAFSFNYFKIISAGEGGAIVTNDRKIYERALIYHDVGAPFWTYNKDEYSEPLFIGAQYRVSEVTGAILRVQLNRLDGILKDLHSVKQSFIKGLSDVHNLTCVKSNDAEGDCASTLGFIFDDKIKAQKFASSQGVDGWLPIDTDRHVYCNWEPVLERKGAHHPALNPYNLPQNKDLNMNYSKDMCPKTLDILSRTVLISLNPDWTNDEVGKRIQSCRQAAKAL